MVDYKMDNLEKSVCIVKLHAIDTAIRKDDSDTAVALLQEVREYITGNHKHSRKDPDIMDCPNCGAMCDWENDGEMVLLTCPRCDWQGHA